MHIRSHLSDLGSNFNAPKNDNFNLNMSIGTIFSLIVLSCISEYGNFSIIKALLTTCLKSELSIRNLSIVKSVFNKVNLSCNLLMSLAIARGCSSSDPCSSKRSASLGSSLFFEINQNFLKFSSFLKLIDKIFEYFFSIIFLS